MLGGGEPWGLGPYMVCVCVCLGIWRCRWEVCLGGVSVCTHVWGVCKQEWNLKSTITMALYASFSTMIPPH